MDFPDEKESFQQVSGFGYLEKHIFKNQRWYVGLIIFLAFTSISFHIGSKGITWTWNNYPFVAFVLLCLSMLIVYLLIFVRDRKMREIITEILDVQKEKNQLSLLSNRQLDVFNLITEGKSNKEITQILHIELSTLKTHINHIYRILNIQNRKQARNLKN